MANSFDVLKIMSERNMKVKMFPRDNVTQIWGGKKEGTIQIKVDSGTALKLMLGEPMVFGLLVADAEQFATIKAELEEALNE